MKVYAVHVAVSIRELGPIEILEPRPPIGEEFPTDSPMRDVGKLFDKLRDAGAFPGGAVTPYPGAIVPGLGSGDAMHMEEHVKVTAGTFEELQAIVAKYHKITESLSIEAVR